MNAPPPIEVADAEWLVGSEARAALGELLHHADEATTASVAKLRKVFTAKQTHLLLEQAELRRRGEQKFTLAERMFFTRVGLQQATDQWVAGYKAKRFVGAAADLCCGIGGDLISLAACGGAVG
ncbi:MAG: SAM-dependent methyltransferase, partial [Planctomycetota bacterium]